MVRRPDSRIRWRTAAASVGGRLQTFPRKIPSGSKLCVTHLAMTNICAASESVSLNPLCPGPPQDPIRPWILRWDPWASSYVPLGARPRKNSEGLRHPRRDEGRNRPFFSPLIIRRHSSPRPALTSGGSGPLLSRPLFELLDRAEQLGRSRCCGFRWSSHQPVQCSVQVGAHELLVHLVISGGDR